MTRAETISSKCNDWCWDGAISESWGDGKARGKGWLSAGKTTPRSYEARRGVDNGRVADQSASGTTDWNAMSAFMAAYCLPTTSPFMQSRARWQPERDSDIYTAGLPDTLISGGRTEIDFCADGSHRQDQDLNLVSLDFSSSSRPHQVEVMANLALNRSLVGRLGKESRIGFRSRQSYGCENSISQPSTTMEYQIPLAPPNKGTASLYWDSIRYTELMGHWVCKLNPRFKYLFCNWIVNFLNCYLLEG